MTSSTPFERPLVSAEWLTAKMAERQRLSMLRASGSNSQTISSIPFCPQEPSERQAEFLSLDCLEAFYGGQGGGGKSSALLMAFLQHAHVPNYSGLILRRAYTDLSLPGAIMYRAKTWLRGRAGVAWNQQDHRFTFRCKDGGESTLQFGYMENENDVDRYKSAEFQYIGFDETSEFSETQYTFMFSRLRRNIGQDVPLRVRSASNPGGVGHAWLRRRFVDDETRAQDAVFVPATRHDNPHLDVVEYERSLDKLDPQRKAWIKDGAWDDLQPGGFFDQSTFVVVDEPPPGAMVQLVRFWDMASSEVTRKNKDPDYTASCLMGIMVHAGDITRGILPAKHAVVCDVTENRWPAGEVPRNVALQAAQDTAAVVVRWEQEGGSAGAIASENAIKPELMGYDADGIRSTGNKMDRARPIAAMAAGRKVYVLRRAWTKGYLDQLHRFPAVQHDDMVDATSGAWNWLDANAIGAPRIHRAANSVTSTLTASRRLGTREQRRGRFG